MIRSKHRSVLAALVAVFAMSVLWAASASAALPEFEFELHAHVTFTGKTVEVRLQEVNGASYNCTGATMTGEITGPKEVAKVVIKFTGACHGFCRQNFTDEWQTKELKGRIGYISKETGAVGLLLEPVAEPVAKCERLGAGTNWQVQGSLIGELGPKNTRGQSFALTAQQSGGKQGITKFEGEALTHTLQMRSPIGPTQMGVEFTHGGMELTTSAPVYLRG
jgi:hypothetical protein